MCTAATYKTKDFYFGRTLDYEFSYGDEIIITPRNYPFVFRHTKTLENHYALIGMACCADNYPLYYDAINEKGLGMAGLNFVGNAHYQPLSDSEENIASFEFIPWILGQCATVKEVRSFLGRMNLCDTPFSDQFPSSSLHWLIADRSESITVECVADGMKIYDNPVGVLTNNPPFDMQLFQLNNYMQLSAKSPENHFSDKLNLNTYSRGITGKYDTGSGKKGSKSKISNIEQKECYARKRKETETESNCKTEEGNTEKDCLVIRQ